MKRLFIIASLFALTAGARSGVIDLNTTRTFPEISSKEEWQQRAREIREQILVSCGLWPMPSKTPLNPKVFGRIERDGYSVEKVYIETLPGFFLGGNLYRPSGKGTGPFPAILNPHGHWSNGRMADTDLGSIAARCINFALQGMVAFSYDMVGYNDTIQAGDHRKFALNATNQLWSVSLMGLQSWNSIRALDFLESLPYVDRSRLACTGESGGGTQTFMLGAIDDRLAAQAPIVMVSHSMQGGCLCENAPGLRVDYSNMEIAAVPAPRPQILVAATGDWTKRTMTVEGPAIESVYRLFKATNRLRYVIFDYDHNYNKTTREAVYDWFGRWLLHENDAAKLKEQPYKKEPDADLRVFPENKPPEGALNDQQLIAAIIARSQEQLAPLQRSDAASLAKWKETMRPAWEHALQIHPPVRRTSIKSDPGESIEGVPRAGLRQFTLPRAYADGFLNCSGALPENASASCVAVLVQPEGRAGINSNPIAAELLKKGVPVIAADLFLTGDAADDAAASTRKHHANFFTTYNRTDLQERISDLKVLVAHVRQQFPGKKVVLVGEQAGGLWAILAAPLADAVIADAHQFDATPENLIHPNIFFPGFYSIGGFAGALRAAAPNPVLVHNLHPSSDLPRLEQLYSAVSEKAHFTTAREKKDATSLAAWITVAVRN